MQNMTWFVSYMNVAMSAYYWTKSLSINYKSKEGLRQKWYKVQRSLYMTSESWKS